MDYVEMLPDNRFIVSEKRVNNSLFKEILKNGSISQIEKAIRERLSVGAKNTEQSNKQKEKKRGMEMTDTERLNKLESFMRKSSSNGIAMMPLNGGRLFSIDDLAHEDGSNLGEEYCIGETLRDAIDALNLDDAY